VVCNSGAGLVPTIDGKMHHFNNVGLYDALFVMQDTESKTLWSHITGEALYGPLVGRSLGPIRNLLQTRVDRALEEDPKTRIAISDRPYFVPGKPATPGGPTGPRNNLAPEAQLQDFFIRTLGQEDHRRPRMDVGLGIWTAKTSRYYPMSQIREHGSAFMDQIEGRQVLIYIDPDTNSPAAMFVNSAHAATNDKEVHLDNGAILRKGVLLDRNGRRQVADLPQQMFTRWYGFALTFPGCEVSGQ
jgi:hypothetical protein